MKNPNINKRKQTRVVKGSGGTAFKTVSPKKTVTKSVAGSHGANKLTKTKTKRSGKVKTTSKQVSTARAKRVIKRGRKKAGN